MGGNSQLQMSVTIEEQKKGDEKNEFKIIYLSNSNGH